MCVHSGAHRLRHLHLEPLLQHWAGPPRSPRHRCCLRRPLECHLLPPRRTAPRWRLQLGRQTGEIPQRPSLLGRLGLLGGFLSALPVPLSSRDPPASRQLRQTRSRHREEPKRPDSLPPRSPRAASRVQANILHASARLALLLLARRPPRLPAGLGDQNHPFRQNKAPARGTDPHTQMFPLLEVRMLSECVCRSVCVSRPSVVRVNSGGNNEGGVSRHARARVQPVRTEIFSAMHGILGSLSCS